jgi:hypothetical protein
MEVVAAVALEDSTARRAIADRKFPVVLRMIGLLRCRKFVIPAVLGHSRKSRSEVSLENMLGSRVSRSMLLHKT